MKLRNDPAAEADIQQAAQWYEDRQAGLGAKFLEALIDAFTEIERHPHRFAKPPKSRTRRDIRRYLLGPFQYAVIYEIKEQEIHVLAVMHTARRPNSWRDRLK